MYRVRRTGIATGSMAGSLGELSCPLFVRWCYLFLSDGLDKVRASRRGVSTRLFGFLFLDHLFAFHFPSLSSFCLAVNGYNGNEWASFLHRQVTSSAAMAKRKCTLVEIFTLSPFWNLAFLRPRASLLCPEDEDGGNNGL